MAGLSKMCKKFADWYADQIREGLDKGLELYCCNSHEATSR